MPDFAATPGAIASFVERLRLGADDLYLRPSGLLWASDAASAASAGRALRLAGGSLAFNLCELIARDRSNGRGSLLIPVEILQTWCDGADDPVARRAREILGALTRPRAPFAGLPLAPGCGGDTILMGIVNVTPDSFSDGGKFADSEAAVRQGQALLDAGAQIVDVGGESTRPGAVPVPIDEELKRVLPVVRALAERGAAVSVDTRHAAVMKAAVSEGAVIVNDVTALSGEAASLEVAARSRAAVVLMHMQGDPATMQDSPAYDDAPLDIFDFLAGRIAACEKAGIARARIVVDPGIGFGKTKRHNAEIMRNLALFHGLGCGVMLGVSRKAFVAGAQGSLAAEQRLPGSLAAALAAVGEGVQLLRVHDVAETRQALSVWNAVRSPLANGD